MEADGDAATLTNVVFMGMGEPLHNLPAVLAACDAMCCPLGLHMSHNKVTVSTVGLAPEIRQFMQVGREVGWGGGVSRQGAVSHAAVAYCYTERQAPGATGATAACTLCCMQLPVGQACVVGTPATPVPTSTSTSLSASSFHRAAPPRLTQKHHLMTRHPPRCLLQASRCQLALSLHATTDEVRDWIVPVNRRHDLQELKEVLAEFFSLGGWQGAGGCVGGTVTCMLCLCRWPCICIALLQGCAELCQHGCRSGAAAAVTQLECHAAAVLRWPMAAPAGQPRSGTMVRQLP